MRAPRLALVPLLGALLATPTGGCGEDRPTPAPAVAPVAPPTEAPAGLTQVAWGERLFQDHGCAGCHHINGIRGVGPPLDGLYDSTRPLGDGGTEHVDARYLRRAVVHSPDVLRTTPAAPVPSYEGQLGDAEVDALVAYLKSLARSS